MAPRAISSAPAGSVSQPSAFDKSNASATLSIKARTSTKHASLGNRKRNYISAATEGMIAKFVDSETPSVTQYQGFTLEPGATATASSPSTCGKADPTTGAYSCTLYFTLTAANGPYTATLTTYDAAQSGSSGTPVAASGATAAVALSTDTETVSVVPNAANNFSFDLHGIVEAFEATPQYIGVPAVPAPSATPLTTTFHALDGDSYLIDAVDNETSFYYGPQPSGTFTPAPFSVTASDQNGCAATPCVALATPSPSIADPSTEGIAISYMGGGAPGDGTASAPPYYGLVGVTGPAGYAGNVSATIGNKAYAAAAYVVPFYGIVDPANTVQRVDASHVSFDKSSDTVNLLALQYHAPTNSTGYAIDTSSCGSIASAVAGTALASGYGESFTLSAGSASGTCTVVLSDGAGDPSTIDVTSTAAGGANVVVPCGTPTAGPDARTRRPFVANTCPSGAPKLVQSNVGIGTVTLPSAVRAGDTLVLAIENDTDPSSSFNDTIGNFTVFQNAEDEWTSIYLSDVSASGPFVPLDLGGSVSQGGTTYWIGEFAGTSSRAISSANAAIDGAGNNTVTLQPDAMNALLLCAFEFGNETSLPGYSLFTERSDSLSDIEIAVSTSPNNDLNDPITLTFPTMYSIPDSDYNLLPDSESFIQIPPASFVGNEKASIHRSFARKTDFKHPH